MTRADDRHFVTNARPAPTGPISLTNGTQRLQIADAAV
jgi:hypothetical protein